MSHKPITKSQTTSNLNFILPPLVNIHSSTVFSSQDPPVTPTLFFLIVMAHVPPKNFVTWNSGIPLILHVPSVVWGPIPTSTLKVVPKFIEEDSKMSGNTYKMWLMFAQSIMLQRKM